MTFQTIIPAPALKKARSGAATRGRSLSAQVARKMLFWACVNTLVLTSIGYFFVSERAEQRALAYLRGYVVQRVRAESQVFQASQANLEKFSKRFIELYRDPAVLPNPDFDAYFEESPDGAVRLRKKYFTGTVDSDGLSRSGVSGFIGRRRAPLTPELKRRLVLAHRLISEYGPAWNGQLVNLHATFPENAIIVHWPEVPWGLEAKAESYFPEMNIVKATLQSTNPERKPFWSPLYFDKVARKWNVTYEVPVDLDRKHLINPSHDILLDDLMKRLVEEHPEGAYNLILAKNGDLIAHPDRLSELKVAADKLNANRLGDPKILSIYNAVSSAAVRRGTVDGVQIIENADLDSYISFARIEGPGWWFVTVYPRSLILESARETANWLLGLGVLSFFLLTVVVMLVLRERVSRPIGQMKVASDHVSWGDYVAVADGKLRLPEDQDNEIGVLARSFKSMATKVGDSARHLERTVRERTLALEVANSELERLSLQDGLTGSYNRRSFDRDLTDAIGQTARGDAAYALLLCDLDYFKRYNDSYGHHAGDECLRAVVDEIARHAPSGRVYRYGGEEIAVLLQVGDIAACRTLAGGLIRAVAGLALPHRGSPYGVVTISAGLAMLDGAERTAAKVIQAADACLYEAKNGGRNRLVSALANVEAG